MKNKAIFSVTPDTVKHGAGRNGRSRTETKLYSILLGKVLVTAFAACLTQERAACVLINLVPTSARSGKCLIQRRSLVRTSGTEGSLYSTVERLRSKATDWLVSVTVDRSASYSSALRPATRGSPHAPKARRDQGETRLSGRSICHMGVGDTATVRNGSPASCGDTAWPSQARPFTLPDRGLDCTTAPKSEKSPAARFYSVFLSGGEVQMRQRHICQARSTVAILLCSGCTT